MASKMLVDEIYASDGVSPPVFPAGASIAGVTLGPAGTAAAPAFSFTADPNTGIFNAGADQLGFSTAGVVRLTINAAVAILSTLVLQGPAGAVGAPTWSFSGDTNTGIFSSGADNLGIACNGIRSFNFDATKLIGTGAAGSVSILSGAGVAATPSYTFVGDEDTGIYNSGANQIGFTANGAQVAVITANGFVFVNTKVLQLGNTAAAGAVVPTHTVTIADLTGTVYRVPCLV